MWTYLLLVTTAFAADDTLMLGNSYIFQQSLDRVVAQVFEASGNPQVSQALTAGGLTLVDHADRATTDGTEWNVQLAQGEGELSWVILQDQSQIPSLGRTSSYWQASANAAVQLNELIEAKSGETMFFLTWGRRDGDASNMETNPDFLTMQENLTNGYMGYVSKTSSEARRTWIAPVGIGFQHIYNDIVSEGGDPLADGSLFVRLYTNDGSHPSFLGTYLAACVFYASITGESPIGLELPSELSGENDSSAGNALQNAAHSAVFEHLDQFEYIWEDSHNNQETGTDLDTEEVAPETDETQGCGCSILNRQQRSWLTWHALLLFIPILRRQRGLARTR